MTSKLRCPPMCASAWTSRNLVLPHLLALPDNPFARLNVSIAIPKQLALPSRYKIQCADELEKWKRLNERRPRYSISGWDPLRTATDTSRENWQQGMLKWRVGSVRSKR